MGPERVRQSPGHAHFWRWKRDPTRTFAIRSVPHPAVETRHNRSVASVGPVPVVLRESSPLTLPIYFYAKIVILRHLKQEVLEIDTDLSRK